MKNQNKIATGFKRTPLGDIPKDWEILPLNSLCNVFDGTHMTPDYKESGIPFYSVEHVTSDNFSETKFISREIFEKENERVKIEKGDILMTRIGDIGSSKYIDWEAEASFYVSLALLKNVTHNDTKFINQFIKSNFFRTELYKRTIHVAFPKKINLGEIGLCKVLLPTLPEQKSIAVILSKWDDAIYKTQQLITQLQQRNKWLTQNLLGGKRRLKGFEKSKWKEVKMKEVFEKVTRRNEEVNTNVVTISAQRGFVRQVDYFTKVIASDTLDNYFLVKHGEFCYNKSYSNGYPWGATKRLNDFDKAVVTTLYICFKLIDTKSYSGDFFEQFFEANSLDEGLMKIAHEGGRAHGLLNVTPSDFFNLKILIPPTVEEQNKIASIITQANSELKILEQKLLALKEQKKGIMQQLLTGKKRVRV